MQPVGTATSPTTVTRPTLPATIADSAGLADSLLQHASSPYGPDVALLRAGIDSLATASPSLAATTRDALAARLSPVDAGALAARGSNDGGGIFDAIFDIVDRVIADVARAEGASFRQDISGAASPADAPRTITFSTGVQQSFQEQWDNSLPGGNPLEQGGTLTFNRETGTIGITNIGGNGSTAGTFDPNLSVSDRHDVAGVFHTHPYSEAEGGFTGVAFSGADIALTLQDGHQMAVVQSGDRQFMILRTDATPASVDARAVATEIDNRFAELLGEGVEFAEASRIASREAADKYGLAYYEGANGTLTRVD